MIENKYGKPAYNPAEVSNKQPSLEMLSKEMIDLSPNRPGVALPGIKSITVSTPPPMSRHLLSVGEYIVDNQGMVTGSGDHMTTDAKTVISKDMSQHSGEKNSEPKTINFKPKAAPRKSNFSSPESNNRPTNLFVPQPVEKSDASVSTPKFSHKDNEYLPRKSASDMNAILNEVNNVYNPAFNLDRFKQFVFSHPIKNKKGFVKFLEEIKTDVDSIKMIAMKEPCPPKVPLRQINKSKARLPRQTCIVP